VFAVSALVGCERERAQAIVPPPPQVSATETVEVPVQIAARDSTSPSRG
jgi:predicted transcriptional regulator